MRKQIVRVSGVTTGTTSRTGRRRAAAGKSILAAAVAATASAAVARQAHATDHIWVPGTIGDFGTAANWAPATVPGAGDSTFVNSGTCNITSSQATFDCNAGNTAGTVGTYNMGGAASTLTVNSWFRYGLVSGGTGAFNLNAGVLNIGTTQLTTQFNIGEQPGGTGFLNILGGTVNDAQSTLVQVGRDSTSTGTATVAGGIWNDAGSGTHSIGGAGTGFLNVSGGTYNKTNGVLTSVGVTGTGTVNVTAGRYAGTGAILLGNGAGLGTINVSGSSTLTTNSYISVGTASTGRGRFLVSGTPTITGITDFNISDTAAADGLLAMSGGSLTAGQLFLGKGATAGAVGVAVFTGGTFTGTANGQVGVNAPGAWFQSGGTFTENAFLSIGRNAAGVGQVDVSGGVYNVTGSAFRLIVAEAGTGTLNVRGTGVVNVTGQTQANSSNAALTLGQVSTSVATVNLLTGGTINAFSVGSFAGPTVGTSTFDFNGGSLRTTATNATFMQNLTHAYVYAGGAIFNTAAGAAGVSQRLETVNGTTGIGSLAVATGGVGYLAPPIVQITGTGTGATAVATVAGGVVTSVTVLNPGTGYTGTPTFTFIGGQPTTAATPGAAALAANANDGGLTKNGANALTLSGVNTFTGGLTVNAGSLIAGSAGAFPPNSQLTTTATGTMVNFNGQYLSTLANTATPALTLAGLNTVAGDNFAFSLLTGGADDVGITAPAVVPGGTITVNTLPGQAITPGTYNLFTDANGGLANFTLTNSSVTTGGVFYGLTLNASNTVDQLVVGVGQAAKLYYTGAAGGDLTAAGNYSTDPAGTMAATTPPTSITDLFFNASVASAATSPTLNANLSANSLEFNAAAGTAVAGTGTLNLVAGQNTFAAGTGIVIDASAGTSSFAPNLNLATSQMFINNSANPFTLSGAISATNAGTTLTLNGGTGSFVLSGNNTYAGTTTVNSGTVTAGSATALGAATNTLNLVGGNLNLSGQSITQGQLVLAGGRLLGLTPATGTLTLTPPTAGGVAINITGAYVSSGTNAIVQNASSAIVTANLALPTGGLIVKPSGTGTPLSTGTVVLGGSTTVALADSPGDPAGELNLAGVVSGTGSLTLANNTVVPGVTFANQQDFGTLVLAASNTYSGGTNLNFGRVVVTNSNALGTGTVAINIGANNASGGTLQLGNAAYTATSNPLAEGDNVNGLAIPNAITLGGAINGDYGSGIINAVGVNSLTGNLTLVQNPSNISVTGGQLTLAGVVSGTGVLNKLGTLPLVLSATDTYSGGTLASAGSIFVTNNAGLGTGTATVVSGADIRLNNGVTVSNPFVVNGGGFANLGGGLQSNGSNATVTGQVNLGTAGTNARLGATPGNTLTVTGPVVNGTAGVNLDISGVAGTAGSLPTFGTVALRGVSTYTGNTTVIRGNLIVDGSNLTAGQANITAGGTFLVGTSGSAGEGGTAVLQNNAVVNVGGAVQVGTNSTGVANALTINAGSALTTTSNVNIATANAASGAVFLNGGTLSGVDYTLGSDALGSLTATSGTFNQTGGTVNARFFSVGFSGFGTANATLTGGTLNVKSSSAYTVGELEVGVFDQQTSTLVLGAGETVNLNNSANLVVGSQNSNVANTVNQLAGSTVTSFADTGTTVGGTGLLILGRSTAAAGTDTYNLSGGTLTVNGITHPGAAAGVLNFNGGTLVAANTSTGFITGLSFANVLAGGAIINTNGFRVATAQPLLNGVTGTDGGLTKTGAGTLALSGPSTYTGGTNITAGTVRANGAVRSLGTGTTTIAAGTTLGGNGSTGGAVVVNGTITGGADSATTGTLTTANQTWNGGGNLLVKFAADGSTNDQLMMSGLTIASTQGTPFVVNVAGVGGAASPSAIPNGTYVLATDTGDAPGVFSNAIAAMTLTLSNQSNSATIPPMFSLGEVDGTGFEQLVLVAAPEPTSLLLLGVAAAPLVLGRRRRAVQSAAC